MGDSVFGDKLNESFARFVFEITTKGLRRHAHFVRHLRKAYLLGEAVAYETVDDIQARSILWLGLHDYVFGIE